MKFITLVHCLNTPWGIVLFFISTQFPFDSVLNRILDFSKNPRSRVKKKVSTNFNFFNANKGSH